jgi:HD superfamily phosphohydrolase
MTAPIKGSKEDRQAISDEICKQLLLPHETIRDPVHGDIFLTALERAIIDTPAFQRLRYLHQLGPTYLVYPGAVHNRFLHSIGTLHTAEMIVAVVNRNSHIYPAGQLVAVEEYPHLLIRLCALLHDVAHIPFGHGLEDEGNLSGGASEWDDAKRANLWLGPDSEIARQIDCFLKKSGIAEDAAQAMMDDIRKYVLHKKADVRDLDYPYVVDVIGNTFCADLFDYLERDMYFCGLRERTGDRAVKYLAILRLRRRDPTEEEEEEYETIEAKDDGSAHSRVVLLAYREERQHEARSSFQTVEKPDVLSEAIDILRRRFTLAEKVSFHRTKIAASAMLISAMAQATFDLADIYKLTDDMLVQKLARDSASPRTVHLVNQYLKRNLYKAPYFIRYREERENDSSSQKLWRTLYKKYREPEARAKLEQTLESLFGLSAGSVVVYCPEKEMNMKQFNMLVQSRPGGAVKKLRNILDQSRRAEMNAVNARFAQLWRLQVLVDPLKLIPGSSRAADFAKLCEYLLDFANSNEDLRNRGLPAQAQFADAAIAHYCRDFEVQEEKISRVAHRNLQEVASQRGLRADATVVDVMYEELKASRNDRRRGREQGGAEETSEKLPLDPTER